MHRYGLFIVTALILLSPSLAQGQKGGYIDPENFNARLLEHYTKKMIDSVREEQGLQTLYNDSTLYLAAKDHARYLRKKPRIGHVQEDDRMATPQLRIEYYGGNFMGSGENVARIYVQRRARLVSGKTGRVRSYREAAHQLTHTWINSPPHYRNMINPDFDITGLAVSYNPDNDAVTAVQTFGMVRDSYTPHHTSEKYFPYQKRHLPKKDTGTGKRPIRETNPESPAVNDPSDHAPGHSNNTSNLSFERSDGFFARLKKGIRLRKHMLKNGWEVTDPRLYYPHKHHDFGITYEPECKTCQQFKKKYAVGGFRLKTENNSVHLFWGDYRRAERAFDDRKDGLVMEIVPFSYYSCDTSLYNVLPRRTNGGCAFNGKIRKPRYKRVLFDKLFFKKDEHGRDPHYFMPYLGSLKGFTDQPVEVNVLELQDNKICRVTPFMHRRGRMMHYSDSIDPLPFRFPWDSISYVPNLTPKYTKAKIHFEPNETKIPRDSLATILRILHDTTEKADLLTVQAYASIEGYKKENKGLFRERADNVIRMLGLNEQDSIRINRQQSENWEKLKEQLDQHHFSFLKGLDQSRIREFINRPANKRQMEKLLDAQRFVQVILRHFTRVTKQNIHGIARNEYMEIYHVLRGQHQRPNFYRFPPELMTQIEHIYRFLLRENRQGKTPFSMIDTLPVVLIPDKEKRKTEKDPLAHLKKLKYRHQLQFRSDSLNTSQYLDRLKYLRKQENTHPTVRFNYKTHQINQINTFLPDFYNHKDIRRLKRFVKSIKDKVPRKDYNSMKLYYHFLKANKAYSQNPYTATANQSLQYIFNHYPVNDLSRNERIRFARYFVLFEKWNHALSLLEPYTHEPMFDKRAYKLSLIIRYSQYKRDAGFDYYKEIFEARKKLPRKEWCELFTADERINFQILDYQPLRMLYCETCSQQ